MHLKENIRETSFRIKSNILSLTKKICALCFFLFYRPIFTYLSFFFFRFYFKYFTYFFIHISTEKVIEKKIVFPRQTSSFIWKFFFFFALICFVFSSFSFFFYFFFILFLFGPNFKMDLPQNADVPFSDFKTLSANETDT